MSEDPWGAFEGSPFGQALADQESRLLRVNRALCKMLGYPEAALRSKGLENLMHPADREKERRQIQRLLAGQETKAIEKRIQTRSGQFIWVLQEVSLVNERILFQFVDITERKAFELALLQSEEKFSKAFQAAPSLIAISRISDGKITDANESFRRTLGFSLVELIGNTVPQLKIFLPEDYQRLLQGLLERGSLQNVESTFFCREGLVHEGLFSAERLRIREEDYMLFLINDITERKQAEESLRQSEEKFSKAFHANPIMMALNDPDTGHYLEVNDSFIQITGYSKEDAYGHNSVELGFVTAEVLAGFYKLLRSQGFVRNYEIEYRTRKREVRYGLVSAELFRTGASRFMIGMVNDVTDLRRAQQAQVEALKQTDRIKDEFLSVVSHELRTPLNAVIGFGSLLEDGTAGDLTPQQHQFVDRILRGGDRMLVLIDDLLDFARLQAGKFDVIVNETDYPSLLEETVVSFLPAAEEKKLTLEFSAQVPHPVRLDRRRIQQVIANLVNNALKFTPDHGRIRVRAIIEGDRLVTEVSDNGIGISAEDLPKLFQPFKQLDMGMTRRAGGVGLGLSISKAIVEAHGGTINADSKPGEGSTFRFCLPL